MPKYRVRTLTINTAHELDEAGFINIINNPVGHNTRNNPPQVFDISVLVNNYEAFGLTPVITRNSRVRRTPNYLSALEETPTNEVNLMDDNNSASNRKKIVKSEVTKPEGEAKDIKEEMKAGSGDLQPNLTPGTYKWLKEVKGKVKNTFQNKKVTTSKEDVHIIATQTNMDIGGEKVIVNIMPDEDIDGMKKCYIGTPPTYTPVNYEETYDYFEKLNANRQQLSRAIYCIGDMLLADELDGDDIAWKQHTDKVDEEYIAWKKKCRRSNDLFEKTGQILGYNDSKYRRFLLRLPRWLRQCFACF